MSFDALDTWWWPYLFILIAGAVTTDSWRFLGVWLGGKVSEESDAMVFVRCVATALVAAVIAGLIVSPAGALAATPLAVRIGSAAGGFVAYLAAGKRVLVGVVACEVILVGWMLLFPIESAA
ncbi:MAG: AzlD domain-containing protein [Rhizobiaceae bacterium]|nr:AzlD domain-containing protein [Rhizobiaceae bacterium]